MQALASVDGTVLGIFQVFSISISDEVAREELVVCSVLNARNVTTPPVLADES